MARARRRLKGWTAICVVAALTVGGSAAWAQSTPPDRDRQPRSETEGQSPPPAGNLSERLDRSKGVIQPPPSVDPGMQVSPPNPDARMPVIPPPGSRNGDQTVDPK